LISQVTRALSELLRPIAASQNKTAQSANTDADRDAMGNSYENLHQGKEENTKKEETKEEVHASGQEAEASEKPTAKVIPITGTTPEELLTARKKAIGISQAWIGLVTALGKQKSDIGEQAGQIAGSGAYEKANTGTSKAARAKKGVIVDKKAA
jgi:hypothetical protein